MKRRLNVVFPLYDEIQPLDVFGPLQVFELANRELGHPVYDTILCAHSEGPVRTSSGHKVYADRDFSAMREADTLVLPGGPGVMRARKDHRLISEIRAATETVRRICSVCTGAYLLAEAGLLAGKRATTHWRTCTDLANRFPDVNVSQEAIYVNDGQVWTSAGVTAGIDMSLAMIAQDHGEQLSASVARLLVVYLRRPGNQAQFSEPLALQEHSRGGVYGQLLNRIATDMRRNWSVEEMADACGQSPRTFQRNFKEAVGKPPAVAVETVRVEQARILLETSTSSTGQIAFKTGFTSPEHMRRAFRRRLGLTPGAIRQLFGREDA